MSDSCRRRRRFCLLLFFFGLLLSLSPQPLRHLFAPFLGFLFEFLILFLLFFALLFFLSLLSLLCFLSSQLCQSLYSFFSTLLLGLFCFSFFFLLPGFFSSLLP